MALAAPVALTLIRAIALRCAKPHPHFSREPNIHPANPSCAVLADRHTVLAEGIRGLLETAFATVFLVADAPSLCEGVERLLPGLVVIDLSLVGSDFPQLLGKIHQDSPNSQMLALTLHDNAAVAQKALGAGARAVVLKRCAGRDFMVAIDAVRRGEQFVSPEFGPVAA